MSIACVYSAILAINTPLACVAPPPPDAPTAVSSDETQTNIAPTAATNAQPAAAKEEGAAPAAHGGLQWRNGSPVLVSEDGRFTIRPLGQLIVDGTTTTGASDGLGGDVANHPHGATASSACLATSKSAAPSQS